jgi:enamine deaminase RidA (YjgF/YER057c/UK114 family)
MGLPQHATRLQLRYLPAFELDAQLGRLRDQTLGVIAFGPQAPAISDFPGAHVDMPVIGGAGFYEVWSSSERVVRFDARDITAAHDEQTFFGCLQIEERDIESAGRIAYTRVFDAIGRAGYPHLVRVWNYFPAINADADGLERYRRFNVGRHDAFVASGRAVGATAPAACALGCRSGPLTVYFLAVRAPGQSVENPRQTSAYHYPARYGPRSPTFSRAMLVQTDNEAALFISGTASIVGHETLHAGDAALQIAETVSNLTALLGQAGVRERDINRAGRNLLLKAYLRRSEDLPIVRECLRRAFGPRAAVVYLHAEICRPDLLVEVEGAYLNAPVQCVAQPARVSAR